MDYERVAEACEQLFAQGLPVKKISCNKVREMMGGGDRSQILAHLGKWKNDNVARFAQRTEEELTLTEIPESLRI